MAQEARSNVMERTDFTNQDNLIREQQQETKQNDSAPPNKTWCKGIEILTRKWQKKDEIEYDSDPEHKTNDNKSHIYKGIILNINESKGSFGKIMIKNISGSYGSYGLEEINIKLPPSTAENTVKREIKSNKAHNIYSSLNDEQLKLFNRLINNSDDKIYSLTKKIDLRQTGTRRPLHWMEREVLSTAIEKECDKDRNLWKKVLETCNKFSIESIKQIKKRIENQMQNKIFDFIELLKKLLDCDYDSGRYPDPKLLSIFYNKQIANQYERLAEIDALYGNKKGYDQMAKQYYEKAYKQSDTMRPIDHMIVDLIVKYSQFCIIFLRNPQQAIMVLAKGHQKAVNYAEHTMDHHQDDHDIKFMHDFAMLSIKHYTKDRAIGIVNGYLKNIQKEYNHVVISIDIIGVLIDFYFVDLGQIWKEVSDQVRSSYKY